MSIKSDIKEFGILFDDKLRERLSILNDVPKSLYEAVEYIIFSGGKRIRPYLMVESFKVFDDDIEKVLDYAIALEMIHTYSLVHDDLPAMDNDDYRRGKLTVHKAYGEDIAILVGDTLLNLAYEIISISLKDCISIQEFRVNNEAFFEMAKYSGAKGMIGGQVLDMEIERDNKGIDILDMYSLKTGGLFKTSTVVGSILGGASVENVEKMREFGELLGLAYQIQDDILDNDEDLIINKATISTVYGKDRAREISEDYSEKALTLLREIDSEKTRKLKELTDTLMGRSY